MTVGHPFVIWEIFYLHIVADVACGRFLFV